MQDQTPWSEFIYLSLNSPSNIQGLNNPVKDHKAYIAENTKNDSKNYCVTEGK